MRCDNEQRDAFGEQIFHPGAEFKKELAAIRFSPTSSTSRGTRWLGRMPPAEGQTSPFISVVQASAPRRGAVLPAAGSP